MNEYKGRQTGQDVWITTNACSVEGAAEDIAIHFGCSEVYPEMQIEIEGEGIFKVKATTRYDAELVSSHDGKDNNDN